MKPGAALVSEALPLTRARVADYIDLTKPRISVLVLFTVAIGALLASRGHPDFVTILHAILGTALVASGASALNQLLEKDSDALMQRTENRPLPAGRLQPWEVLVFGALLGSAGTAYLAATLRQPLAAVVAAFTFLVYVFVYTPLKSKTTLNTLVGAVPGALPPVIGWAAVRGTIDLEAMALFFIIFLWQVPHFLAIAWIYREDYARAGLQMLPGIGDENGITGRQMVIYCLALIPASLAPVAIGLAGPVYLFAAFLLGLLFLFRTMAFRRKNSTGEARRVLRASLLYLPAVLTILFLENRWQALVLPAP